MKHSLLVLILSFFSSNSISQSLTVAPNPMNNIATVSYTLQTSDTVSVFVYNVAGQLVTTPVAKGYQIAGTYQATLDLTGSSIGVYMLVFQINSTKLLAKIVKTDQPAGIKENQQLAESHFYPNPVKDFLILPSHTQPRNTSLTLTDSQGKVVYFFDGKSETPKEIDLRFYPKGIYFLNQLHEGKSQTSKVIKD